MKRFWGVVATLGLALVSFEAKAQNVYPPSNILRVGSQLTFELRQQWTGTVSGKDSDGDWTGNARAANGTQGQFFGFAVGNGGNYAFQVGTTAVSEYCLLGGANSVVSNSGGVVVYQGARYLQQGNAEPTNDNAVCRVTLNNGGGTGGVVTQPVQPPVQQPVQPPVQPPVQQPVQPPSLPGTSTQAQLPTLTFPPALSVGQRWEFRLGNRPIVYRGLLSSQENRSGTIVYVGTLTTDGQGDPFVSRKLEVFFSQDTLAVYATDPQGGITVCSFAGAASLQNNVLTGTVFYRAPGQAQFTPLTAASDAPCRANLEPVQGAVQPTTPVSPFQPVQPNPVQPPVQTLTATLPAQIGDTWRISANGFEPWLLNFTKLDQGDAAGSATQGNAKGDALGVKQNNGSYAFLIGVGTRVFACLIPANAQASGPNFSGALFELIPQGNQTQSKDLNTPCTATLTARGGNTGFVNQPSPTITASFPPKVGQSWTVTIEGLAPWVITFKELDKDGDPNGTGVQSGVSRPVVAFATNDGQKVFLMAGASSTNYYCVFAANIQPQGATYSGGQALSAVGSAQARSLGKGCPATLNSQTLLVSLRPDTVTGWTVDWLTLFQQPILR